MQGGSNRLLSLEEVAERLSVPVRVVADNRRRWGLRSYKVSKFVRIRERDLENWIATREEATA